MAGSGESRARRRTDAPEGIVVKTHRDLVRQRAAMMQVLAARPELMRLMLVNPVLAFRDAGVTISPAVAAHILHSVQHPPSVRAERGQLTDELRAALEVMPRPDDPQWLAQTLFTRLNVQPLVTEGLRPAYVPAIPADARRRLEALLPKRRRRTLPPVPHVATRREQLRRLDLDAPLVECRPARSAPQRLTLEQLWFYRGTHDLVRPLLRLGIIESNALPLLSATAYRKVKSGEQPHDLLRWIDGVSWPADSGARRSQ